MGRFLLLFSLFSSAAFAAVPVTVTHDGYVLDALDQPLDATGVTFSFSLWDDATSTSASNRVWPASPNTCALNVVRGYYAVLLGAGCAPGLTSAHVPAGEARYLEVSVAGVVMTPRYFLGTAPSASVASLALAMPAGSVTNAMLASPSLTVNAGNGLSGGGSVTLGGATTLALPSVGATGSYTNANITVDAYGRVTTAANGAPGGITSLVAGTGLAGGTITSTGTISLATLGTPGTYTNATVTVDSYGRVSSAASGAASGISSLTAGGGLSGGTITTSGTLAIAANGVDNTMLKADAASLAKVSGGAVAVTSGNIGIGLLSSATPAARLDVNGGVRQGNDTSTCTTTNAGTMRWTGSALEVCTGSAWSTLGLPTTYGQSSNPATSCKAIRNATNGAAASGEYWVDPDGAGTTYTAFKVYCDMVADGGGWTLVRVDDATDKAAIKSAAAVGVVPTSGPLCQGSNVKFSDATIKAMWTEKLRFTVNADTAGDMTYLSDTNVSVLTSWSDQCAANNKIFWYFRRAPTVISPTGTHSEYCGWSFGPCNGTAGTLCWYGPHQGVKVHLNASNAHLTIPSNLSALGGEQGCGFGWVR